MKLIMQTTENSSKEDFNDEDADAYILELKQRKRKVSKSKNFELDYYSQVELVEHNKYLESINSLKMIDIVNRLSTARKDG